MTPSVRLRPVKEARWQAKSPCCSFGETAGSAAGRAHRHLAFRVTGETIFRRDLPAFRCVEDLRARRLARVLADWNVPSTFLHVVYPSTRHISPKVKSFIDHLDARMTPPPWELN